MTHYQPVCPHCDSTGWVCKAHPLRPGGITHVPAACQCGAFSEPCPDCNNMLARESPRPPAGFKADLDADNPNIEAKVDRLLNDNDKGPPAPTK